MASSLLASLLVSHDTSWMESELQSRNIRHTCGQPYKIQWHCDSWSAVLSARCHSCMAGHYSVPYVRHNPFTQTQTFPMPQQVLAVPPDKKTAYNYLCLSLTEEFLAAARGHAQMFMAEIQFAWKEFLAHLKRVQDGGLPPVTVGEAYAVQFAVQAEEVTAMLAEGRRDFLPSELMEVAEALGFKAEAGWELPKEHPLALAA